LGEEARIVPDALDFGILHGAAEAWQVGGDYSEMICKRAHLPVPKLRSRARAVYEQERLSRAAVVIADGMPVYFGVVSDQDLCYFSFARKKSNQKKAEQLKLVKSFWRYLFTKKVTWFLFI
jgi:hypothetical protein